MKLFDRLKLKDKLLLLGVLPAAALTLILAVYFTSTRLSDMHDLIDKTNENLARSIAEASINNVFTGNIDALNLLVKESINESNVLSITITNPMGLELTQATATSASAELIANPPRKITQPIELKSLAQKDEFDNLLVGDSTSSNLPMGYVSIAITYDSLKERQQDILLNSFYITLMLLTGIALIARKTSLAIGRPILQLADDVKKIKQGNYSAPRLFINNNDEITILANSIHEMASEIDRHQKELKQKIDLATHELRQQNDKLFTAQGEIIKSAEAKTRFISYISHEIRTPLNGIIGFLEIIQKTNLDNEQKTLANASHLASKNLHVIINEVLDLAQIEADKVVINKSDFRLKQTIQDNLMLLAYLAEKNDVTLDYQHDDNAPEFINQDPIKLSQILTNLVSNAIKFSPGSVVTISLRVHRPEKNQFEICIADQGIGISDDNKKKLFQEFSQLDDATRAQGSGLGLAITKHILNALNGKITVTSTLGKGTVFCFSLPFEPVEKSYDALVKTVAIDTKLPDLSSKRILVADDNEINRLLLANLLERQFAQVTCVEDGQQATDMAANTRFDLMLFDLRMPNKMGDEALREIRNQPENPNYKTPTVAITAHVAAGEERARHISSFDGYLLKPIDQTQFFTLIDRLLKEHDFSKKPFVTPSQESNGIGSDKSFDYEIAQRSMNADPEFMLIMLSKFFVELPHQLDHVAKLLSQNLWAEAADVVHKTSGSAAYCGTPLLRVIAKQFETTLRENNEQAIADSHEKFKDEIKELLTLEKKIIASLKKPLDEQGA